MVAANSCCDRCGSAILSQAGDYCPCCGYPIDPATEEQFLKTSLRHLECVVMYGPDLTVTQLIAKYQQRLLYLSRLREMPAPVPPIIQPAQSAQKVKNADLPETATDKPASPEVFTNGGTQLLPNPYTPQVPPALVMPLRSITTNTPYDSVSTPIAPSQPTSERRFSLRSFLADQTINIIASLGAFLILLGSLSFIITTSDLLLSFIVMAIVHSLFGICGGISYRFRSFRVVAVIYSAIFALQVPLVGFAGYRLSAGHFIQLDVPMLIVITAAYAAIAYGWLAIYHKFELYAYLYVVSLAIVDLAISSSIHLGYWWWPSMLMLLALPSLISEIHTSHLSQSLARSMAVLSRPVRILMFTCVGVCSSGVLITTLYSLSIDVSGRPNLEVRFAIVYMLVLLLCWTALFMWHTGRTRWGALLPYLFLACVIACSYTFSLGTTGYALAFTAVALLYHGLKRFVPQSLRPFPYLEQHLEWLALALVSLVPWIVSPFLLVQIFMRAYWPSQFTFQATGATVVVIATLLVGLILTLSVSENHTGLRKVPVMTQSSWCWLLLLSGFILNWTYGIVILSLRAEPAWCFLDLTLILVALAVSVRRFVSTVWSNPLDVLALATLGFTLLLSLHQGTEYMATELLCFVALSYAIALSQRRQNVLYLPFIFAVLAYPFLLSLPLALLIISIFIPLILAGIYLLISHYWQTDEVQSEQFGMAFWVWPLLVIGPLYGIGIFWHDASTPMSTMQSWFNIPFPIALESAVLALAWYISAALARFKAWLFIMMGFAVLALLSASTMFWWLVGIAPLLAILALGISRLAGRSWALPLYGLAMLAEVIVGCTGYRQEFIATVVWALLGFAFLVYLIGVAERTPIMTQLLFCTAGFFACWSVYSSGLYGDYFFPPLMAVTCAVVGVGIGYLRFVVHPFSPLAQRQRLLLYALPWYATALVAALLTGVYGGLVGINMPFYGAVPDALLLYALIAYAVLLSERRPEALFLVAGFGVWGVVLATQTTVYYIAIVGIAAGLAGLLFGPLTKILLARFAPNSAMVNARWNWPWYIIALVAAIMMSLWDQLPAVAQPVGEFREYSLLAFAALAYIIDIVENMPGCLWIGVGLASCSLIDVAWRGDFYRLFAIALICTAAGLLTFVIYQLASLLAIQVQQQKRIVYALPFYGVALVAAILTGLPITAKWSVNSPFYAALPMALLFYALVAYGVLLLERKATWLWLVACFSLWGTLLFPQTYSCRLPLSAINFSFICGAPPVYSLAVVALVSGLLGILSGRFSKDSLENAGRLTMLLTKYAWSWSWYLTSLAAIGVVTGWNTDVSSVLSNNVWFAMLGAFIVLWLAIMLVERTPEFLLVVTVLAAWTIAQTSWPMWQVMGAYSLLCICLFALQLVWRALLPKVYILSPALLHCLVTLGGLVLVILDIVSQGGLLPGAGMLAHVGACSLCLLAVSLFCYGYLGRLEILPLEPVAQRLCYYGAGLLLSLVISWELLAFGQTDLSLLAIAPATYLIVVSSFLSGDTILPQQERLGGICAISGAIVLLLPTLWSSFSQQNLFPALLLAGEALLLCLVGIGMRVRFFVLSGVALVIVSGIHILFLPSLGIPSFLALTISGGLLLVSATGLMLIRSRFASWS
ncbi:MAG TPA: hypothetical protein VGL94_17595 [Ktedonobacteraceae bacterium]